MKRAFPFQPLLIILMIIISFAAAWVPVSLVKARNAKPETATMLAQGGAVSFEQPQDPPADELSVGPFSTFNGVQLARPDEMVKVMIEMKDAPAVTAFAKERPNIPILKKYVPSEAISAAKAQMTRIERAQQKLVNELSGRQFKARVLSRVQRVFNGVAVEVSAGKQSEIQSLPGVKAVHRLGLYYRLTDSAAQFIGAPRVWDPALLGGSYTGNGVVVAVIDDGIDYLHTNFGGTGSQSHYAINDPAIIGDVPGFPGAVIVSGYDLAGDNFDAASSDPAQNIPQPDPDPFGCNVHGTKVASAIAGRGVNFDGTTYTGTYDQTTPGKSFRIGPGIAPEAALVALKVFGCQGATRGDLLVQAIERAVDLNGDGNFSDHADIINMSLGSPFFPFAGSAEIISIDNAALVGVINVVAAGNNGDTYYGTNGLGQTTNAISVAAMLDDGIYAQNIQITSPPDIAGNYPAAVSEFGPALSPSGFTGSVVLTSPADACTAVINASQLAGNIAFIDRGTCTLVTKVRNAQNAGATAVIVANNTTNLPLNVGDDGTGRDIIIPNYLISQSAGDLIRQQLQSLNQVNASLLFNNISAQPNLANTLLASSSRGGAFGNSVKPDITAPGGNISSSWLGSGNEAAFFTGTSMASPMLAGVTALLVEKYPDNSPDELKGLLYSTGADVFSGANNSLPKHGTSYAGAGTVQAFDAAATDIYLAYKQTGNQTYTYANLFGDVKAVTDNETVPVIVNIANNGNSAQTYSVSYDRTSDIPGVDPSFPSTVNAPGNSNTDYQINWNFIPANMKHTRDATVSANQGGNPRHWLSEEIGYFNFTPAGGGQVLRLPAYFAAYPASNMSTAQNSINLANPTGTTALGLTGQQVHTGNTFPTDEISIASPFELQEISANDSLTPATLDYFDLQHIGVRSNFPTAGDIANTRLLFGVSTYGDWLSPNQVTVNIFIDTNQDGIDDFHLYNTSFPNAQGGPSDVFVTRLFDIANGTTSTQAFLNSFPASQFDTVPFNTNVMILPVLASALGLTDTDGKFDYQVKTSARNLLIDQSRRHSYDATKPGLDFGVNTIFFDLNGATIPLSYNLANLQAAGSEGALLFHHHNTAGNRSQVLPANLGFECDVQPRPFGNGSVTIADWTQVGLFAAGLNDVNLGSEFQRADTAPRDSGGDGRLSIADWVQAGRYSAGLDPVTGTSGPYLPIILPQIAPQNGGVFNATTGKAEFSLRQSVAMSLRVPLRISRTISVAVELEARGDENGFSFSLDFDPAQLSNPRVVAGSDAQKAILYENTAQASSGRVGIALILPPGQNLQSGKRQLAVVTFTVIEPIKLLTRTIDLGDYPVPREIVDINAKALSASGLRLAFPADRRPPPR